MITRFLRNRPIFPVVFVTTTVLVYYFSYHFDATESGLIFALVFAFVLLTLLWLGFYSLTHDVNKSAVITFVSSALIFTYQNLIHNLRKVSISLKSPDLLRFWLHNSGQILVFVFIVLFMFLIYAIVRKIRVINPRLIFYLNIVCILFLIFISFRGVKFINQNNGRKEQFDQYWQQEINKVSYLIEDNVNIKPDIYYIILDGFARSDTLIRLYNIDNSEFIENLNRKGFFVATESYANYTQTRSSLASSLNMRYLDEVSKIIGEDKSYYYPSYVMIDNSVVENLLRLNGYETISFQSEMSFTNFPDWDIHLKPNKVIDRFGLTYISTTAMSVFFNPLSFKTHRENIEYIFDELPLVGNREGPQFIFAHILCPHPPFTFNSDGTYRKVDRLYTTQDANYFYSEGTEAEYKSGYQNQVLFLQGKIIDLVDKMISTSNDPFILIIQGDHGAGMYLDQSNLSNTDIQERFGILNVIYFYDKNYEKLYPEMSPVNTFRIIFSQYFGMDTPILKDSHYYSEYWDLFNFTKVDEFLK